MRKNLLLVLIALLGCFSASGQQNVVKVNPLGLAFGAAQFSYERAISDKGAFEVSLAYTRINASFGVDEAKATGFGAEGKYKFYFSSSKEAPRGWYAAPVVSYSSASAESGSSSGDVSAFSGGAVAGYQWVFGGGSTGFALDLNLGAQYVSASTSGDVSGVDIDGILPRLGVSIGYAW
ncbi:DUF3575 domain-containing protein [Spongiivirga citrea]|uniref:DUF3575 domain-containing protein n=1 Tax=Spongiivirga citrea TaxID=1481457 RepID=A0A6M0CID7_9FLAO|nr:DUF3575 domain-containing protein [Spongiivirga citrea]NER15699.1 DUF3575 domain-containing protein [Spongiivirga citrea]